MAPGILLKPTWDFVSRVKTFNAACSTSVYGAITPGVICSTYGNVPSLRVCLLGQTYMHTMRGKSNLPATRSATRCCGVDVRRMQVARLLNPVQCVSVTSRVISRVGRPSPCCRQKVKLYNVQRTATHSLSRRNRRACPPTAQASAAAQTDAQQLSQSLPDSREQAVRPSQHLCAIWCLSIVRLNVLPADQASIRSISCATGCVCSKK